MHFSDLPVRCIWLCSTIRIQSRFFALNAIIILLALSFFSWWRLSVASILQGKRGIEKAPFHLPDFIAATGIQKIRQVSYHRMILLFY